MKHTIRLQQGCFAALLFISLALTACRTVPPAEMPEEPHYIMHTQDEKNTAYTLHIAYPEFTGMPELNASIRATFADAASEFKAQAQKDQGALADAGLSGSEFYVTTEKIYDGESYISVLISIYCYAGGAHGSTIYSTVTWNNTDNRQETICGISGLTLQELSAYCRDSLTQSLGGGSLSAERLRWIQDGTEPVESNFSAFTADGGTVTIYFQQYQVAPYSEGIPEVTLPVVKNNRS